MKKLLLTSCFVVGSFVIAQAQEECKVLLADISGTYLGDCKGGKANGKGESKGKDTYSGDFKNGLPDGQGKYLFSNGDFYDGAWEKGKKEGQGSFSYKRPGKTDSLVVGYWKKDKYFGKSQYLTFVHNRTQQFTTINIKKSTGNADNTITINLTSTTAGVNSINGGNPVAQPFITDIMISKGTYQTTQELNKGPKTSSKLLVNVSFPFRAKVYVGTQYMDVEISEPGQWTIEGSLNN